MHDPEQTALNELQTEPSDSIMYSLGNLNQSRPLYEQIKSKSWRSLGCVIGWSARDDVLKEYSFSYNQHVHSLVSVRVYQLANSVFLLQQISISRAYQPRNQPANMPYIIYWQHMHVHNSHM